MARTLLDASVLLAVIFEEAGADLVRETLRGEAMMSTVNVGEVAARLHQEGWTAREVAGVVAELRMEIIPFDTETALLSGRYRRQTQPFGLGLGDRACLATAGRLGVPALTADRVWTKLDLPGVTIRCIR